MWVLLSGSTVLKSEDFIADSLNQNRDKIVEGILYYREKGSVDHKSELDFVKKEYKEVPPEVISRICDCLRLSPKQAVNLFISFLSYEYCGSSRNIASSWISADPRQTPATRFMLRSMNSVRASTQPRV